MTNINGVIIKAVSGFYYVECDNNVYTCKAKGAFKKQGIKPLVGDKVVIDINDLVVSDVLERKNFLVRPPVANIDKLFIISSFKTPQPNTLNIDRLIAIAEQQGIEPILIFNKSDLGDMQEFIDIYSATGIKSIITSTKNENSCDKIIPLLKNSVSVFTGNSGVGKTSILNVLFKNKTELKTSEVSEKLGRGRHTTRHCELFKVNDGYIADTPGFSAIDMEFMLKCEKEDLCELFREFREFTPNCKFTSCSHCNDKGCAVVSAVETGIINKSRHESYKVIYNELKQVNKWK